MERFLKISAGSRTQATKKGLMPIEWVYNIAMHYGCGIDWLISGESDVSSLEKVLQKKKGNVEKIKAEVEALDNIIRHRLLEMKLPVPQDIGAYIEVSLFLEQNNINLLSILKGEYITIPSDDLRPVFQAFGDIMSSDNDDIKATLIQSIFTFLKLLDIPARDSHIKKDTEDIKNKPSKQSNLKTRKG